MNKNNTIISTPGIYDLEGDFSGTLFLMRFSAQERKFGIKAKNCYLLGTPDKPSIREKIRTIKAIWRWL